MTLIKERAIRMIQRMPEDNMLYVINILQKLEAMSVDKEKEKMKQQKQEWVQNKFMGKEGS